MKVDLRSEKAKREKRDKQFGKVVSNMTAILFITFFMIVLYIMFWRVL